MAKQLLVSSQVQAALINQFLLAEIQTGFWKDMRPVGHGLVWDGVVAVVAEGDAVGPVGFKPMKNYDFLNPEFTKLNEAKLVEIAQSVKPTMTFKALKKELIELARIVGGRMTDKTKEPARAFRGNNRPDFDVIRVVNREKVVIATSGAKAVVEAAADKVKRTAVKKTVTRMVDDAVKATGKGKKVVEAEDGVTVVTTASGATVRKVAAKTNVEA